MRGRFVLILMITCLVSVSERGTTAQQPSSDHLDLSPRREEQQLPLAMHARMQQLPRIKVGHSDGDLQGRDNRVLQAAVDYIAALGGGIVEIGPGEYLMRDSLHLRRFDGTNPMGCSFVMSCLGWQPIAII